MELLRKYLKYTSSTIVGLVGFSLYILADTYFISDKVGADGLTALNLAMPAFNIMMGFVMLFAVGSATRYNIVKQTHPEHANEPIKAGLLSGYGVMALFMIVGIFFIEPLTVVLGADEHIKPLVIQYLRVLLIFAPMFLTEHFLVSVTRNDGAPKRAMAAMIVASLSNVVLDYVLVYPMNLGIFGAALATGVSPVIATIICLARKKGYSLKVKIDFSHLKGILRTGFSSLVGEWSGCVVMFTMNMLILGNAGNVGVAAYGVVANIAYVMTAVFNGVAQGAQPLASEAYARNRRDDYKKIIRYGMITSLIINVVVYLLLYTKTTAIVNIFNSEHNEQLAVLAEEGLRLYFTGYFFAGINIYMISVYSASEQVRKSAALSVIRGIVAIVVFAIVLSHFMGMKGIWITMCMAELFTLVILILWNMIQSIKLKNNGEKQ